MALVHHTGVIVLTAYDKGVADTDRISLLYCYIIDIVYIIYNMRTRTWLIVSMPLMILI